MLRHFRKSAGRSRHRRLPIALGLAGVLVAGVGQPLLMSAKAEDAPVVDLEQLVAALNGNGAAAADGTAAAYNGSLLLAQNAATFTSKMQLATSTLATDPEAAVAAVQSAATEFALAAGLTGVTQGLSVASRLLTPTCANLATITGILDPVASLLPFPVPSALFGTLAPVVDQLNRGVSDALYNAYSQALATALSPSTIPALPAVPGLPVGIPAPASALALAQAVLTLISFDYTTEYQPASGPAVKRTYKGFSGLPSLLDVDDKPGIDVCATTTFDIAAFIANPTAPLKIVQSISRVPLANPNLGYKITAGALAGALPVGYDTLGSKAPIGFDSTTSLAISSLTSTTTTKMLKPPTGKFAQSFGLSTALSQNFTSVKAPTSYEAVARIALPSTVKYTSPAESGSFTYGLRTVSTSTDSGTGTKTVTDSTANMSQTPGRTSFEACYAPALNVTNGCRKPGQAATAGSAAGLLNPLERGMSFAASGVVDYAATVSGTKTVTPVSGPAVVTNLDTPAVGCLSATPAATTNNARLNGKALFLNASNLGPILTGFGFIDTPNGAVSGCLATAGVTGPLPAGFTATNARVDYAGVIASLAKVTGRSGTTSCAPGLSSGTNGNSYYLPFCAVVPAITLTGPPAITGTAKIGQVLTANPGTWSVNPGPVSYSWRRCTDATNLATCSTISGATSATYTPSTGSSPATNDTGKFIRVVVTAKNFEPGSNPTATSAATGAVSP